MELLPFLRTQVHANRLANHRLHEAMSDLSDAAYAAPRTSFFPSLKATLEHILAVDRYYLAGLHGERDMERQWRSRRSRRASRRLAAAQARADERFIAHAMSLAPADLDDVVELDRGNGRIQRDLRGNVIAHLIAHQLHHRGQAHAMLRARRHAAPARRVPDAERGPPARRRPARARLDRSDPLRLNAPPTDLMENIYLTPEHALLREQIARFIAREVEPTRSPGKRPARRRGRCCRSSAPRACSA